MDTVNRNGGAVKNSKKLLNDENIINKDKDLLLIPGTTQLSHLEDNVSAAGISLSTEAMAILDKAINQQTVVGTRYNEKTQLEIDTEEF